MVCHPRFVLILAEFYDCLLWGIRWNLYMHWINLLLRCLTLSWCHPGEGTNIPSSSQLFRISDFIQSSNFSFPWFHFAFDQETPLQLKVPNEGCYGTDNWNFNSSQSHGILASELNQKLSRLLIEQQEQQIMELESELHLAQSKLQQKEAELQALKDCVRCLTELPLSTYSGMIYLYSWSLPFKANSHVALFPWSCYYFSIHFAYSRSCISNSNIVSQMMKLRLSREPATGLQ